MAGLRLRDRDAIVTEDGLIFRVLGYWHPFDGYVCDVEYAPATIFNSANPKAFRRGTQGVFFKFYEDEGLRFVCNRFPRYMMTHEMLQKKVVGVESHDIVEVRKPGEKLIDLIDSAPRDELILAAQSVVGKVAQNSGLSLDSFGVFGSLLHSFYHPKFSDIDLVVYGRKNTGVLRETLEEMYESRSSSFHNEFDTMGSVTGKKWRFRNLSAKEYVKHQRRKRIYALFDDSNSGRRIKTEFEPVKDWSEINNEYTSETKIAQQGWVRLLGRITEDRDSSFIPSIYGFATLNVLTGRREAVDAERVVSYLEEFRSQACKDETVMVEGNLEMVTSPKRSFYQIVLTSCSRYYEQVLKVPSLSS